MAFSKYFIIICLISILGSCHNKEQTYLLQESTKRLQQQNEIISSQNKSFRIGIEQLMHDHYASNTIGYLKKQLEDLYQNNDYLLSQIKNVNVNSTLGVQNLFKDYTTLQNTFQYLKKRIIDSSVYHKFNININGFMNLDIKQFKLKYMNLSDSFAQQNQLLMLESDVLMNHRAFLESFLQYMTPNICDFGSYRSIAVANKCLFQKGDRLEVTAMMIKYNRNFEGKAVIDGQNVTVKDGLFHYSRIITESPGLYKVPVLITETIPNSPQSTYPAEVIFKVE